MQKLLSITNCQGPVLFSRFLSNACPSFEKTYEYLAPIEVQRLSEADRPKVRKAFMEADVIVAQPVHNSIVFQIRYENLVRKCEEDGKRLILIPALHFSGQFVTDGRPFWTNGYPFGQTEDKLLVDLFRRGLTPEQAAEAYHSDATLTPQQLSDQMESAIGQFKSREDKIPYSVKISDFYETNWELARLHYVKSHPCPVVYQEMAKRIAPVLGLPEPDMSLIQEARGNDQFALPVKTWVKDALGMRFEDDANTAIFRNESIPFVDLIAIFWEFYGKQDHAKA